MHARSKSMLPRIRVALALSAGLAMALLMSRPASAQIEGSGAAWVTIDDQGASPAITFGEQGAVQPGLYASSSWVSGGTFQGEYYVASPISTGPIAIGFYAPGTNILTSILTLSFAAVTGTANQSVTVGYNSGSGLTPPPSGFTDTVSVGTYNSLDFAHLPVPVNVPESFVVNIESPSIIPEIDPGSAGGALACLASGVLMLTARRRKRVTA
jgi:hypothetical protein